MSTSRIYKYSIGDRLFEFDVLNYEQLGQEAFLRRIESLKEGDGVFIHRRYCIVVEAGFTLFGRYFVLQCHDGRDIHVQENRCQRGNWHGWPLWLFKTDTVHLFKDDAKRPPYEKWAGILDSLLEVELGTQQLVLRKPSDGDMYTKQQCLQIVKEATAKSTQERRLLIQFLGKRKLIPNETALYKLLQRDGKGLPVRCDDWGAHQGQQKTQQTDVILWKSRSLPAPLHPASLSKKRKDVKKSSASEGEITRWDVSNERGWRGHIRLMLIPVRELDLEVVGRIITRNPPQLIDICSYIGIGGAGPYHNLHGVRRKDQPCRLYFDPAEYPATPVIHIEKGGKATSWPSDTFERLKSDIRHVAAKDLSPIYCNGGSKKYQSKEFTCNKKFRNVDGKWKKCPFYFQVRWDDFGFYIHLHRPSKTKFRLCYIHNCGSAWHCCKG